MGADGKTTEGLFDDYEERLDEKDAVIAKLRAELLQVSVSANNRGEEIKRLKAKLSDRIHSVGDGWIKYENKTRLLADQKRRIIEKVRIVPRRSNGQLSYDDVIAAIEGIDG